MSRRCFVGIPLPDSYQEQMEGIAKKWRPRLDSRINWTRPGNWHLTLYFLGDVEEEELSLIRSSLARISSPAFRLRAAGGGFFPPGKPPRVIWVGVQTGAKDCTALAEEVEKNLVEAGYPQRDKPFRPHLTLGRVKKGARDDWQALLAFLQEIEWPEIDIDSFVLWESRLSPSGPQYHEIQRYFLE